jgi:fluoroquinolone resistance protein
MRHADDEQFVRVHFSQSTPVPDRCEGCTFVECDFTRADLSGCRFVDCRFEGCDLSSCRLAGAGFQEVEWVRCKAMGVAWDSCNAFLFGIRVHDSNLDYGSFRGVDLSRSGFFGGSVRETDFTGANAQGCVFREVAMDGARFEGTELKGAEFAHVTGWAVDPTINGVRGMRVTSDALIGWCALWGIECSDA